MTSNGKLRGKRALVTGSGTGLGREIALEFARQGADVVVHYSRSAQGAHSAVQEMKSQGCRAAVFQADLSRPEACFGLVDHAVEFLGGIDILVNNAGISETEEFLKVTPEYFDRLYGVNIRGQFFCAQRAVKHVCWIREARGSSSIPPPVTLATACPASRSMPVPRVPSGHGPSSWRWSWPRWASG